jgi:hypothetical protein
MRANLKRKYVLVVLVRTSYEGFTLLLWEASKRESKIRRHIRSRFSNGRNDKSKCSDREYQSTEQIIEQILKRTPTN